MGAGIERVLVTGASGYIGGNLCWRLSQSGYKVTALCYPSIPADEQWVSQMDNLVLMDLSDPGGYQEISSIAFDAIIHLVSLDHHKSNESIEMVSNINFMPIWRLLDAFKASADLKKFIYFSTFHVYGTIEHEVIDESHAIKSKNAYGLTHYLSEIVGNYFDQNSDVSCYNLRLTNSYGEPYFPDNDCWSLVVNDLVKTAYQSQKIVLSSDGSPKRDFVHSTDIFQAVDKILTSDLPGGSFNLSSGNTNTILELANLVGQVYLKRYGKVLEVRAQKSDPQKKSSLDFTVDHTALSRFGFKPQIDLESGIHQLFSYLEHLDD